MRRLPTYIRRLAAVAAMAMLAASPILAQETVTVPHGSTVAVLKYNVCRMVGNSTGSSILVPLGSPDEWIGTHSFTVNAPYFPGVTVTRCQRGGGDDASFCILHQEGDYESACGGSTTWRVMQQSSFLTISTSTDLPKWQESIAWASSNLGAPASARPDNVLPACYRDSSMSELSSGTTYYYIPPDSDFCISRFYSSRTIRNSSSGPEYSASYTYLYRIWR